MALEGSLELFALPEILQMVSVQKKTGILTVQGEQDIIAISFLEGQVVAADALNQTVEEGLGQVLASQGLVSPEDFDQTVRDHQAGGGRLVDLLLERGLLDRFDLLNALRQHTFHLLLQLLGWQEGEFKFYGGDEVSFEEGMVPISVEELLIRSVQEMGEDEAREGMPSLTAVYGALASDASIKVLGQDGDTPLADGSVWLSPDEVALMSRLDGKQKASVHAEATGLGDYKVLYALYRLIKAGLVQGISDPAEASIDEALGGLDVGGDLPEPEPAVVVDAEPEVQEVVEEQAPLRATMEMPADGELVDELVDDLLLDSTEDLELESAPLRPTPGRRAPVLQASSLRWILHPVAIFGLVVLVAAAFGAPNAVLFPYPWLEAEQGAAESAQNSALARKIDRAASTYFLLEGRYPDGLLALTQLSLLSQKDLRDARGNAVVYLNAEDSYRLTFVDPNRPGEGISHDASVKGNFLLDAEFLSTPRPTRPPVILID